MASKASLPVSGRLIRGLAIILQSHHVGPLNNVHVPVDDNTMANIASCPTKARQLFRVDLPQMSDSEFTSCFTREFSLPNGQQWSLVHVPQWLVTNVIKTLHEKRLEMRQWMGPRGKCIGKHGADSQKRMESTSTCGKEVGNNKVTTSIALLPPSGKASTVTAN